MLSTYIDRRGGIFGTSVVVPGFFAVAALLVLVCLRWPSTLAAAGAVAIAFGLLGAINFTSHHTRWLVLPLLVNEAMASVSLIDDSVRPILRYSMLALFCAPYVSTAAKTGLLKKGGFRLYAMYFIWAAVTVCFSVYPFYSFGRMISAALLLMTIVAITASTDDDAQIYELFGIFWIGSSIIIAASAVALIVLPSDITWKLDDNGMLRFAGLFNGPNQIGEIALTTVAAGVICWPAAARRTRFLIVLASLAAIVLDVMADSRSPLIALSVGLILFGISRLGLRAVVLAAILFIAATVVLPRLEGGRDYVMRGDVASLTGRTEIWRYVIHAIKERPVLGYGYEVEGQIFQSRYFPLWEEIWNEGPRSSLHNGYLSRAVGVGIPATLLWAFIILRALRFAIFDRHAPRVLRDAVLIGAAPVLVLNMVESTAGDCRYSVGLLLALIWALSEKNRLLSIESDSAEDAVSIDLAGRLRSISPAPTPIQRTFGAL
ncbi:MAG: O-antigen ligase family protein [Candidatus Binatus sp.]|uniref:O-antigen ligase family protein n=1 Tax=Candidatus Binatus sp. TaxID=2811406 RepID=UPI002726756F|nr:O-antigen ligase family protein [Candidatus Binatus sp.]MDO8432681.1 O-antigen ligase family protein [Candidatus Binatus sp.]